MLDQFYIAKEKEIEKLRLLAAQDALPPLWSGVRPSFKQALVKNEIAVVAEYKRASPSRGDIRSDLELEDALQMYIRGGASALSILTEEKFFKGKFEFLERAVQCAGHTPILRKDFIYEPLQIRATASTGASAVLLIVKAVNDARKLSELMETAKEYGLECVVEIFNSSELETARKVGAELIQVNSRNLQNLHVDMAATLHLIKACPPQKNEVWIAASGITTHADLEKASLAGYEAVLVGTALMKNANPEIALKELIYGS